MKILALHNIKIDMSTAKFMHLQHASFLHSIKNIQIASRSYSEICPVNKSL